MSDRYSRQEGLVPTDKLLSTRVGIAGCGAIGRQLAIQLAAMGCGNLFFADPDRVEAGNLGAQGWLVRDVRRLKVDALLEQVLLINPEMNVDYRATLFPERERLDVLFLCVDRMSARRQLFTAYDHGSSVQLIVDGRMAADMLRVFAVDHLDDPAAAREAYEQTLFDDSEAFQGSCTTRSTIYMASIAAGLMIKQYVTWLNGWPMASELSLGLASMELTTNL